VPPEEEEVPLLRTMIDCPGDAEDVLLRSIDVQPPPVIEALPSMRNVRGIRWLSDFSFFPEPAETALSYLHPTPLDILVALDV
jgi:hypothetical protein